MNTSPKAFSRSEFQRCIRIRFAQQSIINSNVCSQYHSTWEKCTNQFWLLTRFWFLFKHLQTFRKILPLWNDKNNTDWRIKIPHRHLSTPHHTTPNNGRASIFIISSEMWEALYLLSLEQRCLFVPEKNFYWILLFFIWQMLNTIHPSITPMTKNFHQFIDGSIMH